MFNKKRVLPLALAFMIGLTSVPVAPLNVMAEENNSTQLLATPGNASEDVKNSKPQVADSSAYHYVWSDEFNGTELDRTIWNVETHEKGWVNQEWQAYVDSEENIKVQNGSLIIQPKKDGDKYTSGRINTQGKKDMKYGAFEVRAKVPTGKGYLPAFWMMPTNENLYGQWPRCGEIDCMEVMGHETNKVYGTIHYGNPHSQKQNTYTLKNGNFADEFHTYTCEWEPGKITWYVDGIKYHEANDWYTTTEGQGTVTYPAPFDQPFYVILNLAIGGSWVGNPDDKTTYNDQAFVVDYVRAYQKDPDKYNENVTKPEKVIILKNPDANGNYITNGDFATAEDLNDRKDWEFMTAQGGAATASISDNAMKIATTDAGTVDYSVQLVQAGLPLEKNDTYEISFKAKADEARSTNVALKAPDLNYATYWSEDIELGTEYKEYKFTYKMNKATDGNARLEYNMGAKGSTAAIYIDDVVIKKIEDLDSNAPDAKTVRADGNYVYNGSFQEGSNRMEYWSIGNGCTASVTSLEDNRRLKVIATDANATVAQQDIPVIKNSKYNLSFEAQGSNDSSVEVTVAGITKTINLSSDKKTYDEKIVLPETITNRDIVFKFNKTGTFYLDNVRLVEDTMIKNGSFNAGLSGYEMYIHEAASASYVIDSLSENNALDVTIKNTSDAEWKIQLKQSNVTLEKDKYYKLSFDAKSSIDRTIQYAIQRNGAVHKDSNGGEDWTPYVQDTVSLDAYGNDGKYTRIEKCFQMKEDTDTGSIFNIALGGGKNTTQHRVCIDNIVLEEISASDMPATDIQPKHTNLIKNADFKNVSENEIPSWSETIADWVGASAERAIENGIITYDISNVGTEDWNIQLKQSNVILENGETYNVTFDVISTEDRYIKSGLMSKTYDWYGGSDIKLNANELKHVSYSFKMSENNNETDFYISMGKILDPSDVETKPSCISISNIAVVKACELIKTNAVDATCTTPGNKEYYTCSECGKFFSNVAGTKEIAENSWVIPATGHHTTKVAAVAPSCTTAGNKEYFKCNDCGKLFEDANATKEIKLNDTVINATGHDLEKVNATAATCTSAGNSEYFKCKNCGKLFSDANATTEIAQNSTIVNANGHNLTKVNALAPTCTTAGNIEYFKCVACGKLFSDANATTETTAAAVIVNATGHAITKVDAVAPTCTTAGNTEYFKCSTCGKFYSDAAATTEIAQNSWVVAATGHNFESKTVKASSKDGYTANVCSICNEVTDKVVIKAIKGATLSATSFVYNGKAIKPSVTVKDKANKKIASKYYTVTYKNNKNIGKATVKITFKGNYKGSITKTFKIVPASTKITKITKGKKALQIKWNKQIKETTGYQIEYSTNKNFKNAKSVTVSKNTNTSKTIKSLHSKTKYYVRIRTYKTVGKTKYVSAWSSVKSATTK